MYHLNGLSGSRWRVMAMLRKRKLRYAKDAGAAEREPWRDSIDNPASGAFVSLTERSEPSKARWWAKIARRVNQPSHVQYDPTPRKVRRSGLE